MSILQLHHTAFSGGLLSPAFWGRSDIKNFDRALAEAHNFYIDYRGGVKNRPGTRYLATHPDADLRFWTFALGNYADDFLLVFTDNKMRVMKQGSWVLAGTNVLEVATPWKNEDLDQLRFAQKDLYLTVTHPNHTPREIFFNPQTEGWEISEVDFLISRDRPQVAEVKPTTAGEASLVVCCTAVDKEGKESLPSRPWLAKDLVDFTVDAGSVRYKATKVAGARSYKWYRSIVGRADDVSIAQNLGYIGESQGIMFTDRNIIPDFTQPPPLSLNPFAGGQVLGLEIGNIGNNYTNPNGPNISKVSGPGQGLIAYPVVMDSKIESVMVLNWGKDYDPTSEFEIVGGGGSGATVQLDGVSPDTAFPKLVAYFQQRRVFASTIYLPTGIWGSKVADYADFSARILPRDDEGYHVYADIPGNDYIAHILPVQDSILIFHSYGVDRLRGGDGVAITPNNHIVEPQSTLGAGSVLPILVGNVVVYASPRAEAVHAMAFNQNSGGFIPEDLSTYVKHLFTPYQKPKQIVWQPEPDRVLWVLMDNGKLLSLTFVPEQEIYAWAEHETKGKVLDIVCVREQEKDVIYLFVQRWVGGAKRYFLEMMADRRVNHTEQAWFLDCALATNITPKSSSARIKFDYDNIGEVLSTFTLTTGDANFSSGHKGWHIRAQQGLYKILTVHSPTQVSGVIIDYPGNDERYEEDGWYDCLPGEWYLDQPVKSFSGMPHLAGQKVNVLADGNVYKGVQVNGSGGFTLPQPHSRAIAGLGYDAWIKSLPMVSREALIEARKKRIVAVHVRINKSRGLRAGGGGRLDPMRDTAFHEREENLQLRSQVVEIKVSDNWKVDNHLRILQDNPLPAEILGYVLDIEG